MPVETFDDLFLHMARDAYQAEKQHLKALPKLARNSAHPEIVQAFEQHLQETGQQVNRLERIFEIMGVKGKSVKCEAAEGLITEAQEIMSEIDDEQLRDAGIIAAAQALEHYEIARYGTLVAWAQKIGQREIVKLLQETLREEHYANQLLNQLAEQTINEEAAEHSGEDRSEEEENEGERGSGKPRRNQQRRTRSASARRRQPVRKSSRRPPASRGKSGSKSSRARKAA